MKDIHCHWWLKAITPEEQELLNAYREPDPDNVRHRSQPLNKPKPHLPIESHTGRILSVHEREGNAIAALVRQVKASTARASSGASSSSHGGSVQKRGKRARDDSAKRIQELQTTVARMTGTIKAL